jgi:hypothetical protein
VERNTRLTRNLERLVKRLPSSLASSIDWYRPSLRDSWGGPMNGQARRLELVRDLCSRFHCELAVETGAFRGTTTEFLDDLLGVPVVTIEAHPRYFRYSARRFENRPLIDVRHADSASELRRLARMPDIVQRRTFFYLDAHWQGDLPLRTELDIIGAHWPDAFAIVDDFEVAGDGGYGFDAYPSGERLDLGYLRGLTHWTAFAPTAPSSSESGARRGCIVLATRRAAATLEPSSYIRPVEIPS